MIKHIAKLMPAKDIHKIQYRLSIHIADCQLCISPSIFFFLIFSLFFSDNTPLRRCRSTSILSLKYDIWGNDEDARACKKMHPFSRLIGNSCQCEMELASSFHHRQQLFLLPLKYREKKRKYENGDKFIYWRMRIDLFGFNVTTWCLRDDLFERLEKL